MDIWHIRGGRCLCGTASVQGAKNAVLPILAAAVINGGRNVIYNCPDLRDVTITIDVFK